MAEAMTAIALALKVLPAQGLDVVVLSDETRAMLENWGKAINILAGMVDNLAKLAAVEDTISINQIIIENLMNQLQQVASWIMAAIGDVSAQFDEAGSLLDARKGEWLRFITGLVSTIAGIVDNLAKLADVTGLKRVSEAVIRDLANELTRVARLLLVELPEQLVTEVDKGKAAWAQFAASLTSTVGGAIDALIKIADFDKTVTQEQITRIAKSLINVVQAFVNIAADLEIETMKAAQALGEAMKPIADALGSFIQALVDFAESPLAESRGLAQQIAQQVQKLLQELLAAFQNLLAGKDTSAAALAYVKDLTTTLGVLLGQLASNVDIAVEARLAAAWSLSALEVLLGGLIRIAQGIGGAAEGLGILIESSQALAGLLDIIRGSGDAQAQAEELSDTLARLIEVLGRFGQNWLTALAAGLQAGLSALSEAIQMLINRLTVWMQPMVNTAFDFGEAWMLSIVNGIYSRLPDLEAALAYLRGLFPTSPAKIGPFREPLDVMDYFVSPFQEALSEVATLALTPPSRKAALAPAYAAAGPGGGVTINIQNLYGTDREAAERFGKYIVEQMRREGIR
jgi:hypothetical protein